MDRGIIRIQTPVGPLDCEVELEEADGQWLGRLLARPGVTGAAQAVGATRDEVMAELASLAQREHEIAVEREIQLYGGRPAPSSAG